VKYLGGPPYLTPDEVAEGEVVTIRSEPTHIEAEQSKWGKERYRIAVELKNRETGYFPTKSFFMVFTPFILRPSNH